MARPKPTFQVVEVALLSPCRRCHRAWARVLAPLADRPATWSKRCETPECLAGLDLAKARIFKATPEPGPFARWQGMEA